MKPSLLASQVSLVLFGTISLVHAHENHNHDVYQLNTVTVLGSPVSELEDSTQSGETINREELQVKSSISLVDVLKSSPNVWVEGGPNPMVRNISIRGLGPEHTYVEVDGARQTYSHSKKGTLAVNPELLSSLEVINGTSSGAAAGAIKASFIDADTLLKSGDDFGALLKTGYRTNSNRQSITASVFSESNGFDWLLAVSDNQQDPYRIGGGYQADGSDSYYKNEAAQTSYLFNGGYDFSDSERLAINYYFDESSWNQVRQDFGLNTRDYTSASMVYTNAFPNNPWLDITANIYMNNVDTLTNEYSDASESQLTDVQDITDDSYGFSISNNSSTVLSWSELVLHYGASAHFTTHKGNVRTYENDQWVDESATNEPSAKSNLYGVWLNSQFYFDNGLEISPKLRYDQFYVESSNAILNGDPILRNGRTEDQWSFGLRAEYEIFEQFSVFAAFDEALTPPRLSQLFTSGRGFKPNPNLKSERSQNKEIGGIYLVDNLLSHSDVLKLKANIFQNDIKDYIGTDYSDPAYKDGVKVNRDDVRLTGGELIGEYQREQWAATLSYSMTIGKDQKTDLYLSDMPADKLVATFDHNISNEWMLGTAITHAFKLHRVPTASISTGGVLEPIEEDKQDSVPSWTTVDLYAEYVPQQLSDLTLTASITNLFDEAYALKNDSRADTKAEYYEEGRSINLNIAYQF